MGDVIYIFFDPIVMYLLLQILSLHAPGPLLELLELQMDSIFRLQMMVRRVGGEGP